MSYTKRKSSPRGAKKLEDGIVTFPVDDPRHGTPNGYGNLGCRCLRCRQANRESHSDYLERHPEQRISAAKREREKRGVDETFHITPPSGRGYWVPHDAKRVCKVCKGEGHFDSCFACGNRGYEL